MGLSACASLPSSKYQTYTFPKRFAFLGVPTRPFRVLGTVRSRVDFQTLISEEDVGAQVLCRNYYNRAVQKLVEEAQAKGADAVIQVRSVSLYLDRKVELSKKPACSDDGAEGQVLAQGVAVRWGAAKTKKK